MMASFKDMWLQYRAYRRHRRDIRAFNRLMDARSARRMAA